MTKCTPHTHMHSERGTVTEPLVYADCQRAFVSVTILKGRDYLIGPTKQMRQSPEAPGFACTLSSQAEFLQARVPQPPDFSLGKRGRCWNRLPHACQSPSARIAREEKGGFQPSPSSHWGWSTETLWDLLWPRLCMKRAFFVTGRPGQSQCTIMGQKQAKFYPVSWWH